MLRVAARFEPARSSQPEPEPEPEPDDEASAKAAGRLAFGAGAAVGSVAGEGESFANPVAEAGDDESGGGDAAVRFHVPFEAVFALLFFGIFFVH